MTQIPHSTRPKAEGPVLPDPFAGATIEHVATADGARITVKRRPVAGGVPVVMAHGIATNGDQWDLPEVKGTDFHYRSLASRLEDSGFDLWILNFRGCGWPSMYSAPPERARDWNVDHYIAYDLPAVLDHVARATGQKPVVISQSMGSLILAAHLAGAVCEAGDDPGSARMVLSPEAAAHRQAALRGAIFIEMPAALKWPTSFYQNGRPEWRRLLGGTLLGNAESNYLFEILSRWRWLERPMTAAGRIPLERLRGAEHRPDWWHRLPGKWRERGRRLHTKATQRLLDASSIVTGAHHHRAEVVYHVKRMTMDGLQAGVLRQFGKCVRAGAFVSDTGSPDVVYSDHYEQIALPLLCLAGGRDRIANATVTKEVFFQRVRSADKQFILFDQLSHGEFSTAPISCELVYPPILDWLRTHTAVEDSATGAPPRN
jgi:pimeloyl-ACP methyl ester carboxylesterase